MIFENPVQKILKIAVKISPIILKKFFNLYFSVTSLITVSTVSTIEKRLLKIAAYESTERMNSWLSS
jgi:hypothetical protein